MPRSKVPGERARQRSRTGRRHVVLIPGFGGFDALGQMEYYAGVTQRAQGHDLTLHYFDNLPTAAVETRAQQLERYISRLIARGIIRPGDDLVLVGHSTGGLDIRWLVHRLSAGASEIHVDGGPAANPADILEKLRKVVFLSVPHHGTHIADWVRWHRLGRQALIAELRAGVGLSQVALLEKIESCLARYTANLPHLDLIAAIKDSLLEANEYHDNDPAYPRTADAHEAASQLALYLRHIAADFRAIDDLAIEAPDSADKRSPAHFDATERAREQAFWRKCKIDVRSYVTFAPQPFSFTRAYPPAGWWLFNPLALASLAAGNGRSTDIAYRFCYRACATDSFPVVNVPKLRALVGPRPPRFESWDGDGIVNSLSMFWPRGENLSVQADHMDIVGHFERRPAERGSGRAYRAYDLLVSDCGFEETEFNTVWSDVFDFCSR
jgi:triacylglycerol lipase